MRISDWSSDVCSSDLSQGDSVRHRLIDIDAEMSSLLERPPTVRFGGAVDHLVGGDLAEDCVAVARELLSNSVRHSGSDDITLEVVVDGSSLTVMVQDGGAGIASDRRSGLANLEARAQARGGTFDRSEEHTSELQSLMRISDAVFCLKKQH